ncbi:uncharacterized protein [Lolium perenne]|uniref:uncharacterized protein n=1 Tax=Lolium perenne TaxID=4522 RepID=UPI003A992857
MQVNTILEKYCNASGQRVNLDKSSIFFSKGCTEARRQSVKNILNVPNETLNEKYLGMPSDVGKSKNGAFKYLKDRMWKKIQGWLEQLLASAGKEVLIKAVAMAIPIFSMSCFKLPRGLCEAINAMLRSFWWGNKDGKRKTCWVSWETMCSPKFSGGMGFRDIEIFNLAMLARQAWRILQNPAALSSRILKAVYHPSSDFLEASLGSHPSQVWRAIVEGRDAMKQGLIRRIGSGENTHAWNQNWLPRDHMLRPLARLEAVGDPPERVSSFIDATNATWNTELLHTWFLPMDVEVIKTIPLSTRRLEDRWAWHYDKKGVLTVRSMYHLLVNTKKRREDWLDGRSANSDTRRDSMAWRRLWSANVPPKIRVFLWRLAHQSIPTADVRCRRNMATSSACCLCGAADSWRHSLIDCAARCVWALADEGVVEHLSKTDTPVARLWLAEMTETLSQDDFTRVAITMWAIWYAKRKIIYEEVYQSPLSTHLFIEGFLRDLAIQKPSEGRRGAPKPVHPRWIPPAPGCVKLNVDAAMRKSSPGGAVAVICRGEAGDFMGASTLTLEGITDPATMEAIACREAMALAHDLMADRVTVASDCLTVVNAIHSNFAGSFSVVIDEIKEAAKSLPLASFRHESRESNKEAHRLARSATSSGLGRRVWFDQPPDGLCIRHFVMNE